jgi:excisionase family DNA binding protein
MPRRPAAGGPDDQTTPLYVRLPRQEAELLDRAAFDGRMSKRELVTSALRRYLGAGDGSAGEVATPTAGDAARAASGDLAVGRHAFHPGDLPEVLTLEEAAGLLRVPEDAVVEMAEAGELPARRMGGEWRLSRTALLAWLGSA